MANGTYEQFSYDNRSRVTDVSTKNSSNAVLRSRAYSFNVASQVTQVVEGAVTTSYGYDLAGQLTSEVKSSGYAGSYSYDANGNRLTRVVNGVTENYSYDAGDKLLSVSGGTDPKSFVYDAAGRTTGIVRSSGTTAFSYDYESRVTQITKPGMTTNLMSYNGLDTRVSKTDSTGSKTFRRDGVGVTAPVLSDGAAVYTPGVSESRGGVKTYFHQALKNTDLQSDSAGAVTATRLYDAWGNVVSSTGTWASPFGNAGRFGYQEDPDSGLKLLGHRYYDSSTGRFLTRDPAKDGRNWYGYCGNSPVRSSDPTGLVVVVVVVGLAIIGIAATFAWFYKRKLEQDEEFQEKDGAQPNNHAQLLGADGTDADDNAAVDSERNRMLRGVNRQRRNAEEAFEDMYIKSPSTRAAGSAVGAIIGKSLPDEFDGLEPDSYGDAADVVRGVIEDQKKVRTMGSGIVRSDPWRTRCERSAYKAACF